MPVKNVKPGCYQYGNQKVYCGPGAKQKAIKQGRAIQISKQKKSK